MRAKLSFKKEKKCRNSKFEEQNFSLGCFSGLLEFWSTFQISTKKYAAAKFCSIFKFLATQKLVGYRSGFNASCYENIPRRTHNMIKYAVLLIRNTGSDAFLTPGSGIRIQDGKKSWSGTGMNIPDNFSECLETDFRVKNT
jgi:hypothetical protein